MVEERVQRELRNISGYFFNFYNQQKSTKYANFHGLRDFYSLCKHIGYSYRDRRGFIQYSNSIRRNFGGLPTSLERSAFHPLFQGPQHYDETSGALGMKMIEQNLRDPASRYLMVIAKGDSILNAIGSFLHNADISEYRIVVGSKFKEDDSENYRYQMLSEIILSMEKGESLILVDLDGIYGSLYDMSNQNFTTIAGKKHCRVALGAYSNPMAHVHDKFKCIVVVDVAKVYGLDPPFLNRFEKQQCNFTSLLQADHQEIVKHLEMWVESLCTLYIPGVNHAEDEFPVRDTFIGYAEKDTISSLVFAMSRNVFTTPSPDNILRNAKRKLLKLVSVAGMIRIMHSNRNRDHPEEIQGLCDLFFADTSKINLRCYLRNLITFESGANSLTTKSIVTTYSQFFDIAANLRTFIPPEILADGANETTIEKMALIGSQRTLASLIHDFYRESNPSSLYILQCDAQEDLNKLLLTKFLIDQEHASYQQRGISQAKHIVVIFSLSPELYEEDVAVGFNAYFSRDWEQIHIDNLEENEAHWEEITRLIQGNESFNAFATLNAEGVIKTFEDNLMSTFSMLTYRQIPSAEYFQECCERIQSNESFKVLMYKKIMQALHHTEQNAAQPRSLWLLEIARNREYIYFSPSFYRAIQLYLKDKIKLPSMLSIYLLERSFALETYANINAIPETWQQLYLNSPKLDLRPLITAHNPQKVYEIPPLLSNLRFPFSYLLFPNIEEAEKASFLEEMDRAEIHNKQPESIQHSFQHRILQQYVTPFFRDAGINVLELNMNQAAEDVIRMFVQPHVYLQQLPSACDAMQVLLRTLSNQPVDNMDAVVIQLLLWNMSKPLLLAVKLLMFGNSNGIENIADTLGNVEELVAQYQVSLFQATQGFASNTIQISARLQMAELLMDFTERAYPFCSNENEDTVVSLENFSTWANSMATIFPTMLAFCNECQLQYLQFDPSQADCLNMVFVYETMVPRVVGLRILMDLADLLQFSAMDLSPEQSASVAEVLNTYLRMEEYEGIGEEKLSDLLQMLQDFVDKGLLPEQEVTHYTFKILERYLLVALVSETANMKSEGDIDVEDDRFRQIIDQRLLQRQDYATIAEVILKHRADPPLACQAVATHFVEKVVTAINQGELLADMPCFGSLDAFSDFIAEQEVLEAFESLFDREGGMKDSLMETLVIDMVFTVLKQHFLDEDTLENDMENICEIFENLVRNWSQGMEDVSFVQRIYGAAFIKWFLEESHIWATSEICQGILNRVFDYNPWSHVHYPLAMYWLKLFKKPMAELRIHCGENSALLQQHPWLQRLDWNSANVELLAKLLPAVDLTNEQRQACEEAWDDIFDRLSPSNTKMQTLIGSMPINELLSGLIAVAFKKQCRTAQPFHQLELTKISELLPNTADPNAICLLQQVHSRFINVTTKDWTVDDVCIFLIFISFLTSPNGIIREGIFGKYAHEAQTVRTSFVLAANSDPVASVLKHLRQTEYSYFKCPCGFVFVIDNCRQPMQRRPCPNCNRSLGGAEHAFDNTGQAPYQPVAEDKVGYCYLSDSLNVLSHSERRLSPNEYRILAFFVHCSILGGLLFHPADYSPLFADMLVNSAGNTAIDYCWTQLSSHWEVLRKRLVDDGRSEALCGFMLDVSMQLKENLINVVPMNTNQRETLEEQIAGHFRPLLANFVQVSAAAVEKYTESTHTASPFERALEERDEPIHFLGRFLRICKSPSFANLEQSFTDMHDGKEKFPVLAAFFKFHDKLDRIKWILPIVEWTNHVRKVLNFQITSDDVTDKSVRQIAAKHQELDLAKFDDFLDAWNYFFENYPVLDYNRQMYEMLQNAECHDVIIPHALSQNSMMMHSCIRVKGNGRESAYLLHQLAELQNAFLTEVLPFVKQYRGASEKFIQNLSYEHQSEVISYDADGLWKAMTKFVRANVRYGHGRQLDCDWMKIEQLIIQRLIDGKSFLKSNIWQRGVLEEFRFKDELFKEQYRLFHHVRALIPQDRTLPTYRNIVHDPRVRDQSFLQDRLLPALQSLLYVLQHQSAGAAKLLPDCHIGDFAKRYLDRSTNLIFAELEERNSEIVRVPLKQIEILYEVLEDRISDAVLACVKEDYFVDLSEKQRKQVVEKLLPVVENKEEELESSIRRFIVRYLRGSQGLPSHWPFSAVLDIVRWPKDIDMSDRCDEDPELEDLMNSLTVGQTGSLHKLLHELIDDRRRREAAKQSMYQQPSSIPSTTKTTSSRAAANEEQDEGGNKHRRRRVMKNLSGFSTV